MGDQFLLPTRGHSFVAGLSRAWEGMAAGFLWPGRPRYVKLEKDMALDSLPKHPTGTEDGRKMRERRRAADYQLPSKWRHVYPEGVRTPEARKMRRE